MTAHAGKKVEFVEKSTDEMTEEERIAELGRPRLGDPIRIACHIRESMEFKVSRSHSREHEVQGQSSTSAEASSSRSVEHIRESMEFKVSRSHPREH